MPQPMGFYVHLGWSGWLRLLIGLGLVLAVAAVVAIFLLGVFIVLLPVALVSALLLYFFPSLRNRRPRGPHDPDIIDGEYRIVDPRQLEREREPGDRS
jgi:hypothetical protein